MISITKYGKPLDPSLYTWDEESKTFSTNENSLVLDFSNIDGVTFKTGSYCTFTTGYRCTFKTGSNCSFKTGSLCTFNTGSYCTFTTDSFCTFTTGYDCTFTTDSFCTFTTDSFCTFTTGSDCTFDTGSDCTFKTGSNCTFKTGSNCVVIRRDIFEVILLEENKTIKLNEFSIIGFRYIKPTKTITIEGKDIEISEDSFNELKKQLLDK
jgi:hypothetical protein